MIPPDFFSSVKEFRMNLIFVIGLVFCLTFHSYCEEVKEIPVVIIPGVGKVKGDARVAANNKEYVRYLDIPYAEIKENGWFQPSIPISPTDGVINEDVAPACPSLDDTYVTSENEFKTCLVLKIESRDTTGKNPVIVHIPGYNLGCGTTLYTHGTNLMMEDVVLITIQCRVGVFGFLSTQTEEIPGNIGVLDIIEALKWIQKHISHFGGDPNRITLNGEYLAGGMIGLLTASPLAEGLFHQVIYLSGSPEMEGLKTDNPLIVAKEVAFEMNCTDVEKSVDLNKCLLEASVRSIMDAYTSVWKTRKGKVYPITIGGPSGVINNNYKYRKYPTIGGFVDHPVIHLMEDLEKSDLSVFSKQYLREKYEDEIEKLSKSFEDIKYSKTVIDYFGTDAIVEKLNVTDVLLAGLIHTRIPVEIDLMGLDIKLSVLKALAHNKNLGGNSYLYIYKFNGPNYYYMWTQSILQNFATLGDDLQLLYSAEDFNVDMRQKADFMVKLWTSFAATGIPIFRDVFKWPEIVSDLGPYLVIDRLEYISYNVTKELTPMMNCQKTKGCKWVEL